MVNPLRRAVEAENEVLIVIGNTDQDHFSTRENSGERRVDSFLLPGRFERDIHSPPLGRRPDLFKLASLSPAKKAWSAPRLLPPPRDEGVYPLR